MYQVVMTELNVLLPVCPLMAKLALLLDVTQASAGYLFAGLCGGMLVVNSKLVVISTRAEEGVWKVWLTNA